MYNFKSISRLSKSPKPIILNCLVKIVPSPVRLMTGEPIITGATVWRVQVTKQKLETVQTQSRHRIL